MRADGRAHSFSAPCSNSPSTSEDVPLPIYLKVVTAFAEFAKAICRFVVDAVQRLCPGALVLPRSFNSAGFSSNDEVATKSICGQNLPQLWCLPGGDATLFPASGFDTCL